MTSQLDEVKQVHEIEVRSVSPCLVDIVMLSMNLMVTYDANNWRNKYKNEAVSKIEELEAGKLKLQARLSESESTLGNLNNKLVSLEKHKHNAEKNIEDAKYKLDQAVSNHGQAEKKIKMMDRVVSDWKRKADDLSKELSSSQMEQRNIASELFKSKMGSLRLINNWMRYCERTKLYLKK